MLDCFTIRLKEAVDNKDLPVAGSVKIHVSSGSQFTENDYKLRIYCSQPLHVKALGGGSFSYVGRYDQSIFGNNISEADLPTTDGIDITFASGDYNVLFTSIEDILVFAEELNGQLGARALSYDLTQFNDATALTSLAFYNPGCSGTFIPPANLTYITAYRNENYAQNTTIYMNVEDFSNCLNIIDINVIDCGNVTGSIEALSPCTQLQHISAFATDMSGDVKTLFDNMYAAGRISGIFYINVAFNGKMTFNGTVITPEWIQSQGGDYVIRATFNANGYTVDYPVF